MNVKDLRAKGFKVRICHLRKVGRKLMSRRDFEESPKAKIWSWDEVIQSQGGKTIVTVTTPTGEFTVEERASCKAPDNYNRRLGVSIALGRALKILETQGLLNENFN